MAGSGQSVMPDLRQLLSEPKRLARELARSMNEAQSDQEREEIANLWVEAMRQSGLQCLRSFRGG